MEFSVFGPRVDLKRYWYYDVSASKKIKRDNDLNFYIENFEIRE